MKTITKYICEVTGKEFADRKAATDHEQFERRVTDEVTKRTTIIPWTVKQLVDFLLKHPTLNVFYEYCVARPTKVTYDGYRPLLDWKDDTATMRTTTLADLLKPRINDATVGIASAKGDDFGCRVVGARASSWVFLSVSML